MAARRGRPTIGIDLSLGAISMAQVQAGKVLHVHAMNASLLEPGTMAPDGTVDWARLEAMVSQTLLPFKHKRMRAYTSIPNEWSVVRQLNLPDFSDDELRSLIEFELTHSIHLPFEDVVFDFVRCTPTEEAQAEGKTSILLIAADGTLVESWVNLLQRKGMRVGVVDLRPLAKLRVLKQMRQALGTFLFVDHEVNSTYIYVFHQNLLYLSRPMILRMPLNVDSAQEVPDLVYAEQLSGEMERTMDFFRYTLMQRDAEFSHAVFSTSFENAPLIQSSIAARLGIDINMMTFQQVLESHSFVMRRGVIPSQDESFDYTAAIGVALRGV